MKFSIVTPSYNCSRYIRETIDSIWSQSGDFEIEHIIFDGGSSDDTVAILKKYDSQLSQGLYPISCNGVKFVWVSEKDGGMYDAINKGFARATGEIYAWLNADDVYLPGAFEAIRQVFATNPGVRWLKGITSYMNESSVIRDAGKCYVYEQSWLRRGVYGRDTFFVQQDSVFWTADLWKTVGGCESTLKYAGDYQVWLSFSKLAPLLSVKTPISCFRRVQGQLSSQVIGYRREMEVACPSVGRRNFLIRIYCKIDRKIPSRQIRGLLHRLLFPKHRFMAFVLDQKAKNYVLKRCMHPFI